MTGPKQIKACLFDMDGLLVNTEDIYTITCNEILTKYGKGPLTWDVKLKLQGLPGPEAGDKLISTYDLPLTYEEYNDLNIKSQETKWPTCAFLPGAQDLIHYLHDHNVPIALCTSSNKEKLQGKTSHLKGFDCFDAIVTGDDARIPKGRGKPCPDIYQLGLKELNEKFGTNIKSDECLVFEELSYVNHVFGIFELEHMLFLILVSFNKIAIRLDVVVLYKQDTVTCNSSSSLDKLYGKYDYRE